MTDASFSPESGCARGAVAGESLSAWGPHRIQARGEKFLGFSWASGFKLKGCALSKRTPWLIAVSGFTLSLERVVRSLGLEATASGL